MSKKIVAKGVVAIAMVGFVFAFSACKKEEPKKDPPKEKVNSIVGKWRYEKAELKEVKCIDPTMEPLIKMAFQQYGVADMIGSYFAGDYEFTKNGKLIISSEDGNYEANYVTNGNKLTITGSDILSGTFDYSISGKKMYWDIDGIEMASLFGMGDMLVGYGVTKLVVRITLAKQ